MKCDCMRIFPYYKPTKARATKMKMKIAKRFQ